MVFTYGSKWKQRYYTQIGDDYFVFPAQWDVQNRQWRRYYVRPGTDWWAEYYPEDQMQRPTGPLCDGCHSVNYDIQTKTVTEWNVGCEKCHGAGGAHLLDPVAATIVNPASLDDFRANDVCIQCHSQGRPRDNPIDGRYYDWPVGYRPGDRLSDTWELEEHHLGEESSRTGGWNGSQEPDAGQRLRPKPDVRQGRAVLRMPRRSRDRARRGSDRPGNDICVSCHTPQLQPGPRGSLTFHTRHERDSEGSECAPAICR